MTRVLTADDARGADAGLIGGKAANLARLAGAGVEVPAWVVIPTDATGTGAGTDPARGRTDAARLVPAAREALRRAGIAPAALLAVRSSAVGEDAAAASFAGQFATVLGVPAADDDRLADAIATVLASTTTDHALAYAAREAPRMAVILQELVDAAAAGVAFSADPVTGDRRTGVVSAVHGLGEALVSGAVDADTFRVRYARRAADGARGTGSRVIERTVVAQDRALRREGAGTRWAELEEPVRSAPAITDDEAVSIAEAAGRLAAALGSPQDVEWALAGAGPGPRRLIILQTRPITSLPDGELRIWDNSNIIESYAGVTTPLTFSFARGVYEDVYRQFCGVLGVEATLIERNRDVFANMLGLIRGRVYYNLLNWYRVLALLPGYAFNRAFMERMMGVREKLEDPPDPPPAAGKWEDLWRLVRGVAGLIRANRRLGRSVPAFHARVEAALGPLADEDLATWSADALLALYRRLEDDLLRHWQPPLVNDFFAMIWFGVLGRLVETWLPDHPPTLINDLLAGEGGIISTEPAREVMALARMVAETPALSALFEAEPDDERLWARLTAHSGSGSGSGADFRGLADRLRAYLRRFGDRSANELKLETITLRDDPTYLVATVRAYWRQGATDPDASREREQSIRREAEAKVRAALRPVRRRVFLAVLRRTRHRIRDRENLRFERTRVFGVVRRIFLGFGRHLADAGRLEDPRDVFWLTTGEVFGWVEGTGVAADLRAIAAARRAEFELYEATPSPPERFETWGAVGASSPALAATVGSAREAADAARPPDTLTGTGCCPGVIRAPVRIVRDPREAGDLSGRILVAERTDPGWTLLFPAAAGLLVQRGSLLSHSAIVAREVGLPCVVAIPRLLETLREGEVVEMDGTSGVVRRLEGPVPAEAAAPEPAS